MSYHKAELTSICIMDLSTRRLLPFSRLDLRYREAKVTLQHLAWDRMHYNEKKYR